MRAVWLKLSISTVLGDQMDTVSKIRNVVIVVLPQLGLILKLQP